MLWLYLTTTIVGFTLLARGWRAAIVANLIVLIVVAILLMMERLHQWANRGEK